MILRLVRKDLLQHWTMAAAVAGGFLLLLVMVNFIAASEGDRLPLDLVVFLGTAYPALLVPLFAGRDDRHRTTGFDLSLPVTRRQVLLGRYLLALALHVVWLALSAAVCRAWGWPRAIAGVFSPFSLALSLAAFTVGMGTTYPLVLRWGFVGMLYGLVGFQVLGVAVYALAKRWTAFASLVSLVAKVGPGLRALHARLGDPWYLAGVFAALTGLVGLSYAASAAALRRREH